MTIKMHNTMKTSLALFFLELVKLVSGFKNKNA